MPLSPAIVELIRDEIGPDPDFANDSPHNPVIGQLDSLENIYTNTSRGNVNVLRTALICWRMRRFDYVKRGFDATAGGSLMARRQRMKELNQVVKELEILIDTTFRNANQTMVGTHDQSVLLAESGAEF